MALLFIFGVITGFAAKWLWDYKKAKGISFTPLQTAGLAIWLLWVASGIFFTATSLNEYETRAASLGALIFGVVAIAGLVLLRVRYLKTRPAAM